MDKIFLFIILIYGCTNLKNECHHINNIIKYDDVLYGVRKKVIDLTWIEEPLTYPEFSKLTNYSECFRKQAVSFIKLNKDDKTMIGLSILSMKGLKSKETILFANEIIDSIDEENLLLWICGSYGNNNFIKNYMDANYVDFINLT